MRANTRQVLTHARGIMEERDWSLWHACLVAAGRNRDAALDAANELYRQMPQEYHRRCLEGAPGLVMFNDCHTKEDIIALIDRTLEASCEKK